MNDKIYLTRQDDTLRYRVIAQRTLAQDTVCVRHFYRAGETTVEISEYEYERVLVNPNMYYFSKALEVNYRFQQKRNGLPGLG